MLYSKNCKYADKKLKANEFLRNLFVLSLQVACTRPRIVDSACLNRCLLEFTARELRKLEIKIQKLHDLKLKSSIE